MVFLIKDQIHSRGSTDIILWKLIISEFQTIVCRRLRRIRPLQDQDIIRITWYFSTNIEYSQRVCGYYSMGVNAASQSKNNF